MEIRKSRLITEFFLKKFYVWFSPIDSSHGEKCLVAPTLARVRATKRIYDLCLIGATVQ